MANESTYTGMSGLVNSIIDIALLTASEQSVMPALVRQWNDSNSSTTRIWAAYTGGTVATVTEATDMSAQTFTPAAAGTLTPVLYGTNYFLTDKRIRSDPFGAQRDAGEDLGRLMAVQVDTHLSGLFSSLTGGTVGSAGGTITWANIMRASAYVKTAFGPGPYAVVLHPVQWYYLTAATSGVPTLMQNTAIANSIVGGFYQASFGGMDFFTDANITSGTAAVGGLFSRDAIALDVRNPFKIEPQRDASRAGGGWELNATMEYAKGVYRPTFGCQLIGTSA
jgi:hypothetical protein